MPLWQQLQHMVISRFTEAARLMISDLFVNPENSTEKASLGKHLNQTFLFEKQSKVDRCLHNHIFHFAPTRSHALPRAPNQPSMPKLSFRKIKNISRKVQSSAGYKFLFV